MKNFFKKNYIYDKELLVWRKDQYNDFDYSDGKDQEEQMFKDIQTLQNLSSDSNEYLKIIRDWPSEYHFTPLRNNLLRPFSFITGKKILEIGCGLGAITRFLGEKDNDIIALEGSLNRAKIAAYRCKDLVNVNVVCDNLESFEFKPKFDIVTLIGVLEYTPKFIKGKEPIQKALKIARQYLKKDGMLIIAIENKLGLKYFAGMPEDHLGIPFYGIQNLYENDEPITFGKKELDKILKKSGFNTSQYYYPFPDYKLPSIMISQKAIDEPDISVSNILLKFISRDYSYNPYRSFNEQLSWINLEKNEILADMANSFLVFCKKDNDNLLEEWLVKGYQVSRPKEFQTEMVIQKKKNRITVNKKFLFDGLKRENIDNDISIEAYKEEYIKGNIYLWKLLKIFSKNKDLIDIVEWVRPWFYALCQNSINYKEDVKFKKIIKNLEFERIKLFSKNNEIFLPGKFIDAVPFNFVLLENGYKFFDLEWKHKTKVDIRVILFRGIFYSLQYCEHSLSFDKFNNSTLVKKVMSEFIELEKIDLDKYFEFELGLAKIKDSYKKTKSHLRTTLKNKVGVWISYRFLRNNYEVLQQNHRVLHHNHNALQQNNTVINRELIHQKQISSNMEKEISSLKSTLSWKITVPLRYIKKVVVSFKKKISG